MSDLLVLAVAMLATGAVGGLLAGLLGIGGGIVIIPALDAALSFVGVDPSIRMHIVVATSLATIIPTSIASARAHQRRDSVDTDLFKRWGMFVLLGALLGSWIASQLRSTDLSMVFAAFALLVAIKMLLPLQKKSTRNQVPGGPGILIIPTSIGALSSMLGIGGGTLSVAVMTFFNQPIHKAVGTASLFGLAISLPGTAGFMLLGMNDPRLPIGNFGYVNLIGFALISPMTVMTAPFGAAIAHRLSQRHLSLVFGIFLLAMSVRMALRAF
jgi:uncharacterized membrane protein YfcA